MGNEQLPLPSRKKVEEAEQMVDGVLGWVQKKKLAAKDTEADWSWVVKLIAAAVVFFGLAFAAWSAWKRGREIAKLKHQLDKDKEEKRAEEIKKGFKLSKEKRNELDKKIEEIEKRVTDRKETIADLEAKRKEVHTVIDKITSWEDVDRLLGDNHG